MRRLPVFFVLDCSESMIGDNFEKLQNAMDKLSVTLKKDPNALENVYISVIAFAGIAKTIVPLIELSSYYLPQLNIGSGTNLNDALLELMNQIETNVVKTNATIKGDWKPLVFIITDGKPTSDCSLAINQWKVSYKNKAKIISIAVGKYSDINILQQFSDDVLYLNNELPDDINNFIKWVSASIITQSKSVSFQGQETNLLINLKEAGLKKIEQSNYEIIDIDCAVFVGKCQNTKKAYLIKYDCNEFNLTYDLTGCYPINDSYFQWSDKKPESLTIDVNELNGFPACPYCGAFSAFALCSCGKLMCFNGQETSICPWCEKNIVFEISNQDESFQVTRGRG